MSKIKQSFRYALPFTLPICAGFLFLGMSYGFLMIQKGFPVYLPIITSAVIFAGSMEFILADLLFAPFQPIATFLLTFMVNARHIFYGLSMLEKFQNTSWKKPFLIFGMCDESFSINCNVELPKEIDSSWFMLHVTFLNYLYWVIGVSLGAISGKYIRVDTTGIDFVLAALFLVIFTEQWLSQPKHKAALTGILCSVLSLWIFGSNIFVIPAMLLILCVFTIFYRQEKKI
ncbi:MAG: AzlC family ABC transporter permease [Fusobacterium necrophorum]|nr:AzlC family ABC transporter permease [Fusobacterium necrophorum]MCI7681185.1 AzlC family ABC transporter permease [Fusobacterium necrophorum]